MKSPKPKCPRCQGLLVYEAPRYQGEQGSARCLLCSHRIWEPAKVVMPEVPVLEKDRSYATGAANLQKAREVRDLARHNQLLLQMAVQERDTRQQAVA